MSLIPLCQLKERAEGERERLRSGEKPKPRFENRIQGLAVRLLAGFFALMLLLTLVSRAADGVTVAKVQVESPKTGVLTRRLDGQGTIEAVGDLGITLPAGLTVTELLAKEGQRVSAGDPLLRLDAQELEHQMATLKEKLRINELRLSGGGAGTSGDSAVLEAQLTLAQKQEDLARLQAKLDKTSTRGQEDLAAAQAGLDEARLKYDKAVQKAKDALIKAADEAVKAAEDNLAQVKESAAEAIESAQMAVDSAEDAESAADSAYYNAQRAVQRAQEKLNEAKNRLSELQAAQPQDPDAIAAAQAEVDGAQASLDAAQSTLDGSSWGSGGGASRARATLKRTKEKWEAKTKEAEANLKEVKLEQEEKKKAMDVTEDAGVLSAHGAVEAAEKALAAQERTNEDGVDSSQDTILSAHRAVEGAQRALEEAQRKARDTARTDAETQRQAQIDRLGWLSENRALKKDIAALAAAVATGGVVSAPNDALVESMLKETGKTQDGVRVATLSRSDGGFTYSCQVEEKSAMYVSEGDKGSLGFTQNGESRSVDVIIASVSAADDKGMVTVTAELPAGSYPAGASASLELSKRSEQFDTCLPIGALRAEGTDYFVLVVREKQTVLGTEQTVEKVPVTLGEKDSKQMAVTSDVLQRDDKVVVSATKPLEAGDRVRTQESAE